MNKLITLLALALTMLFSAESFAQVQPVAPNYYPMKIIKFNASYPALQQPKPVSDQVGKMSNAGYTDTTDYVAIPRLDVIDDTLLLGFVLKTNLDTLSTKITLQFGFGGIAPDSSVANAGAFASLTGAALSADNVAIARKTTVTYDVADFMRLKYANIPPGATHVRAFLAWQANGQSIESDGAFTDHYELYFVWPQQRE